MLIMLCGIALELNRLTPKKATDPYDSRLFGILMVTFSIIIVLIGLLAILFSIPSLETRYCSGMKRCERSQDNTEGQPERFGCADEGLNAEQEVASKRRLAKDNAACQETSFDSIHAS